jgi:hypothetical protein
MSDDKAKPYIVQTTAGVFCSGHDGIAQAEASAEQRNKQAEALGIEARYEAKAR